MDRRTFLMLIGAGSAVGATDLAGAPSAVAGGRHGDGARPSPAPVSSVTGQSAPETVTVPLHILDIEGVGRKIGIEIRLGGGEPRLYTFDTGSSGFYAARDRDWWPEYRRVGGAQIEQTYGSHEIFRSKIVRTSVGIPTESGEIEVETEVGQIHDAWGGSLGARGSSPWRKDVAAGRPPLFGNFFGDFGSGLREKNGLFAVLPQLPGNLSSGFAVRLGCGGGPGPSPTLEIGLTEAIRSEVATWVPMAGGAQSRRFPNSGRPTYTQELVAARYALDGAGADYAFETDSILDTGCPTTTVYENGALQIPESLVDHGRVVDGTRFRVAADGAESGNDFSLEFPAGDLPGNDQVVVTPTTENAFVNLGLIPFFRYNVVFDIERGLVGFGDCG
jgi:hypothetical protein